MSRVEDNCCNCDVESYPCSGQCYLRNSVHYYCDCCKEEFYSEELYDYDGQELCEECLLKIVPKAY